MSSKLNLPIIIMIISTSLFCAFSTNLKSYADDKIKRRKITYVYYLANTLIYTISGVLISLISTLFSDDIIVWVISAGIGGFIGRKLLLFVINVLIKAVINVKSLDNGNIKFDELEYNEDDDDKKK